MLVNKSQEDLEKKKKKHRKRDKLWKFLFPKNKAPEPTTNLDSEQNNRINALEKYATNNFSFCLDHDAFKSVLEKNDWDFKKATLGLRDYEEAVHGILINPPAVPMTPLLGSENDNGTSCYIDALLFAMFISNTAFDPLLTYDISPTDETKIQLQTLFRLFVNKLRKGHLIPADYVHWLRKVMETANWNGRDRHGHWSQQDASELFLFITEFFDLPYLPFQIRLFHGANRDTDDDRVMTDRMVALAVPENTKETIRLEDILVDYFYNNVITGIKRQVESDIFASPSASSFLSDKKMDFSEQEDQKVAVTAWQVLELLPFYSASNEQGDAIQTQVDSSFPDTHMILPILLKRYCYKNGASVAKISTKIDIPPDIDFNRFVNQSVDDPTCSVCGHLINWTLHFKSAVCHKGNSPYSGHYIGYARVPCEDDEVYWLKLDDLDREHRVTMMKEKDASDIFNDLAKNAYLIFYELDKTCHHDTTSISSTTSKSAEWMDDVKQIDSNTTYKTGVYYSEYDKLRVDPQMIKGAHKNVATALREIAIGNIYLCFLNGQGIQIDKHKALEWLSRSRKGDEEDSPLSKELQEQGVILGKEDKEKPLFQLINETEDLGRNREACLEKEVQELKRLLKEANVSKDKMKENLFKTMADLSSDK